MNFQVIDLESGQPFAIDGAVRLLETGAAAADLARELTVATGKKHQPRAITNDQWRERERQRFASGHYLALPDEWLKLFDLYGGNCADHYAHVGLKDQSLVAFTESKAKGSADVQTRMKPGRYLKEFYGHILDSEEIKRYCNMFAYKFEENRLLTGDTADDFQEVYNHGPHSCMQNVCINMRDGSNFYVVRVYAAGDLQIAYLKRGGTITGRAVIFPKQKTHSRIYGDVDRMQTLLRGAGYKWGSPYGAKLLRVVYPGYEEWDRNPGRVSHQRNSRLKFIVPYIDRGPASGGGSMCVEDNGDHLLICSDKIGAWHASATGGYTGEYISPMLCQRCQNEMRKGDQILVNVDEAGHGHNWCQTCALEHTWRDRERGNIISNAVHPLELGDGSILPPWRRDETFLSRKSGKRYRSQERMTIYYMTPIRQTTTAEYWHHSEVVADLESESPTIAKCRETGHHWKRVDMFYHPELGLVAPGSYASQAPGIMPWKKIDPALAETLDITPRRQKREILSQFIQYDAATDSYRHMR